MTDDEIILKALIENESNNAPRQFFNAVMEKFQRVAKYKDRSLLPWKDYEKEFLHGRLVEEMTEFYQAWTDWAQGKNDVQDVQDELIDVASFAMMLWLRLEGNQNDR